MIIRWLVDCREEFFKNLEIFSPSTLKLRNVSNYSLGEFFNSNEKLVELVIDNCDKPHFNNPSTLNSLKSLTLLHSAWNILNLFPLCKNIQEIIISEPPESCPNPENDKIYLTALMTGQEKLETLIIDSYFPLDYNVVTDAKYNLKQLSVYILGFGDNCVKLSACLLQIMKKHKNTLDNLELIVNDLCENFMEFIMKNLKVRRLFITAALLPKKYQIYEKIQPNLHLKKLVITNDSTNSAALQGLIRTYPTIESLIILRYLWPISFNEAFMGIFSTLKSLKLLQIPSLTLDTPVTPMPSLRTFKVDFLDFSNFLGFSLNILSIEHLAVKSFKKRVDLSIENIEIMASRLSQLRHIKFGQHFKLTTAILNVFSRNCPQLRLIEMINKKPRSDNVTHDKIQVVYFAKCFTGQLFKEEKTLWNKTCADLCFLTI